ncbi:unnamed protein product [Acanthoscelides obtectus]|uniref:Uncharacterized protein n=1 Tax=Acanthoscelides obtectus TaxID=200917 RepID=A0A9P0Q148_ACAOB|nr:unnamed protein product [Acanthoscelides obtectus]CAK1675220.1 SCAN domain-containing protein 3 [Acanthoscelides obtectus]
MKSAFTSPQDIIDAFAKKISTVFLNSDSSNIEFMPSNLTSMNISLNTKRPTLDRMFASTSQRNDDGLRASYNISLLIAKSGKPHTIGEKLILLAVEEDLKTVLHKPASDIIKRIPLSNNTVERRIDGMSSDIESFLCNYLQTTHFSIQLDESTLPDNAALLLAYVRFIMNQEIYEELIFARTLITDTKVGLGVFSLTEKESNVKPDWSDVPEMRVELKFGRYDRLYITNITYKILEKTKYSDIKIQAASANIHNYCKAISV